MRDVLGVGFPGGTYERVFYVADVEAAGPVMNDELHVALDDEDFMAVFPLHLFAWQEAMDKAGLTRNALYLVRLDGYVALADAGRSPAPFLAWAKAHLCPGPGAGGLY